MNIEFIESLSGLTALEREWRDLEESASNSALFSSFDFMRCVFQTANSASRMLAVVRERSQLLAVLPLLRRLRTWRGIPCRGVGSLTVYGCAVPPLVKGCLGSVLPRLLHELAASFERSDVITLKGLPFRGCLGAAALLAGRESGFPFFYSGSEHYYISLENGFPGYFCRLQAKTRRALARRSELAEDQLGRMESIQLRGRALIDEGLGRMRRLFAPGTLARRDRERLAFYQQLAPFFVAADRAELHLRSHAGKDISCLLVLEHQRCRYEQLILHSEEHRHFSPALLLRLEAIKASFGGQYERYLMPPSDPREGEPHDKVQFASGRTELLNLDYVPRRSLLAPVASRIPC